MISFEAQLSLLWLSPLRGWRGAWGHADDSNSNTISLLESHNLGINWIIVTILHQPFTNSHGPWLPSKISCPSFSQYLELCSPKGYLQVSSATDLNNITSIETCPASGPFRRKNSLGGQTCSKEDLLRNGEISQWNTAQSFMKTRYHSMSLQCGGLVNSFTNFCNSSWQYGNTENLTYTGPKLSISFILLWINICMYVIEW